MSDVAGTAVEAAKTLPPSTVDALKSALVDIINGTVKSAGDAKDFVLAQVPDVVQQLVAFYTVYYAVLVVTLFVISISSLVVLYKLVMPSVRNIQSRCDRELATIFTHVGFYVLSIVSFVAALSNVKSFLMVWIAPKVWLIHYAVDLVQEIKK